jgi:hypothetical protein
MTTLVLRGHNPDVLTYIESHPDLTHYDLCDTVFAEEVVK